MVRRARERLSGKSPVESPIEGASARQIEDGPVEVDEVFEPPMPPAHSQSSPPFRDQEAGRDPTRSTVSTPPVLPRTESRRSGWLTRIPVGWLIAGLIFAGGSMYELFTSADRDESGIVVGAGDVASEDLQVGDCLLLPDEVAEDGSFEFESLRAVPCNEPHDLEVFGRVRALPGPYPGEVALSDYGQQECAAMFESYVGLPVEHEARLIYSTSYPLAESWTAGDRMLDCMLQTWDGSPLTGSQEGQGLLGLGGLTEGNCYDYTEAESYVSFVQVVCGEPHMLQLFATSELPHDGLSEFPGDVYLDEVGADVCNERFDALVAPEGAEQEVDYFWIAPDSSTWGAGDRLIQCHLFNVNDLYLVGEYVAGIQP